MSFQSAGAEPHSVFVLEGPDLAARNGVLTFLCLLALQPSERAQAVEMTGVGSSCIGTVLDAFFNRA